MIQSLWYFFLVFALMSCASVPTATVEDQDKEALISRIHAYWNAKQKDDFQPMTGLMDPDTTSSDTLNASARFNKYSNLSKITDVRIDNIDMLDKERAKVIVTIQVSLLFGMSSDNNIEQTVTDIWIKNKGSWFISMNKPSIEEIFQKYQNQKDSVPQVRPN
jgi:hypothetical protein